MADAGTVDCNNNAIINHVSSRQSVQIAAKNLLTNTKI